VLFEILEPGYAALDDSDEGMQACMGGVQRMTRGDARCRAVAITGRPEMAVLTAGTLRAGRQTTDRLSTDSPSGRRLTAGSLAALGLTNDKLNTDE